MSDGRLTLVPTPIGNLDDITIRALETLKSVNAILCEDTRHTGKLLQHHEISNSLQSFHQHNEHVVTERFVERIRNGEHLALVSDAGTPGISDPGYLLMRASIEAGLTVEVLPGASAILPAVVASGLPCEKFLYLGFPPQKKGRQTFWATIQDQPHTMVIYESPHRIRKALEEAINVFGEFRHAVVVRELTKIHESYHRGNLSELLRTCEVDGFKGEIVLVVEGKSHFDKRHTA